jgi:hypothetical protein
MMNADDLATELFKVYQSVDADGNSVDKTDGSKAFAKGFIDMMTQGKMTSMVTGLGMPNGAPFPGTTWSFIGQSVKGNFVGLVPNTLAAQLAAAIPKGKPNLMLKEATAISSYFMTQVNITFVAMYGQCTAATGSPPTPGVIVGGNARDGKVVGAAGAGLAAQVAAAMGVPITPGMIDMYNALCNYVTKNIELSYLVNQVNGAFPPPPPAPIPLAGGLGSGGVVR